MTHASQGCPAGGQRRWSRTAGHALAALAVALAACHQVPKPVAGSEAIPPSAYATIDRQVSAVAVPRPVERLTPEQRMPALLGIPDPADDRPRLFSFKARNLPIRDALGLLARANGLNIVADPDVSGLVTVDFTDVPLTQAFEILLSSLGYAWEEERGVIRVRSSITRTFELDYIRAPRTNSASASARATAAAGGGGATAATTSSDSVQFWQELEQQIRAMLTTRGRLIVNRLTGSIMVTDLPAKVADIDRYISLLRDGMYRQIDIEVRIAEVTLRDDFKLGLDWSRLRSNPLLGRLDVGTRVTAPDGLSGRAATLTLAATGDRYAALLDALREQGDVRVVSQPRIRIMNNQTAFVKVGTDDTFFVRTTNRTIQPGGGVVDSVNEQPVTVNVGVMLSVTPQISADGWAMINVAPTVTRLVGTAVSPRGDSTAPILDVKEASTLVRARSGELVLLGGLIQEEASDTNRSVPLLGEIPGIGAAFKSTYQAGRRKELVIFLAPTILSGK